ncbi:hypothetical protein HMN09_00866000 [Mycena chlorophos]|uniref:Uncharacterized protein n=1 Tax=Mycena chlorophos TaxID=658473 RepID=A0A8H6W1R1_MYCCL|nr:hypothetical protein HMN09_00866000 [Mycena chlorophos]
MPVATSSQEIPSSTQPTVPNWPPALSHEERSWMPHRTRVRPVDSGFQSQQRARPTRPSKFGQVLFRREFLVSQLIGFVLGLWMKALLIGVVLPVRVHLVIEILVLAHRTSVDDPAQLGAVPQSFVPSLRPSVLRNLPRKQGWKWRTTQRHLPPKNNLRVV